MGVLRLSDIVRLQNDDGGWGPFHTLGTPTRQNALTTEQALRRLIALGMGIKDEPIAKALCYMRNVLDKKTVPPDRRDRVLNWDYFEAMMMAAWIKLLSPEDDQAGKIAGFWANIVEKSVYQGSFEENDRYKKIYRAYVPKLNGREREIGAAQFYMVTLLRGMLSSSAERAYFNYVLHNADGIYYVYHKNISQVPKPFASIETSRYLAALECLAGYSCARRELRFAAEWIKANRLPDGMWDLGAQAKDGIYLPLSDNWRTAENRKKDCTARVGRILNKLL